MVQDGADPVVSQLYTITAADVVGTVITCRQLFRDARTNEILSDASNGITIVARPAGAITFAPVITDDGTPNANTPGHILTASATNIVGGTAPIEYEYNWLVDGLTMGTNKTLNIIQTFVGKIVTCEITVAEPTVLTLKPALRFMTKSSKLLERLTPHRTGTTER